MAVSFPAESRRCLGELWNFRARTNLRLWEEKGEVCKEVWENKFVFGKGKWWLSWLEQRAPCLSHLAEGRGVRLWLLLSPRPTLGSSPGEDRRDSLVTQFPQNHFPKLPPFWRWFWQNFRWTLVCYPHYFNFVVRSRQPKNSLVVPLPKPFRMVFSSTPRESCDLDLHREAEALRSCDRAGRWVLRYYSTLQEILHPNPHIWQHLPLSKSLTPSRESNLDTLLKVRISPLSLNTILPKNNLNIFL